MKKKTKLMQASIRKEAKIPSTQFSIRLTPKERKLWEEEAVLRGLKLSQFIRFALREWRKKP